MPFRDYICEVGHSYNVLESIKADLQIVCQEEDCSASVRLDWSKLTGVQVKWKDGPPTPQFGGRG